MEIEIKGEKIELKNKVRAMLIYEEIRNKAFNPVTLTDMTVYFYSIVLANKPSISLSFDGFINYLDANPGILDTFLGWLATENEKAAQMRNGEVKKKAML